MWERMSDLFQVVKDLVGRFLGVSFIAMECLFLVSCGSLMNVSSEVATEEEQEEAVEELQVHFIDVGQGDATLVFSGDHAMLIDAGDDSKGTKVQLYLQNQGIEKLDYLVLTHTDADHIGGADVVISKFDIGNVLIGDYPKDNKVYRDLMQALETRRGGRYLCVGRCILYGCSTESDIFCSE